MNAPPQKKSLSYILKGNSTGNHNLNQTLWSKKFSLRTGKQTCTCENFVQTLTWSPTPTAILQHVHTILKNTRCTLLLRQLLTLIRLTLKKHEKLYVYRSGFDLRRILNFYSSNCRYIYWSSNIFTSLLFNVGFLNKNSGRPT